MTAAMADTAAGPHVRAVEVLTDEELSLLVSGPGAVVTPYFSTLAARDVEQAQRSAYRSLVARGIVDIGGRPQEGPVRLLLREDVMTLMTLRETAVTLVAVARTTTDGQDFWYAHVVEDLLVVEEVSEDGLHRFALAFTRDLPALLVGAALHPDATDGLGDAVRIAALPEAQAPAQLLERLGRAHVRADVVVLRAGHRGPRPELVGLHSGPDGSWSVTSTPGEGATARPETVEGIRTTLHGLAAQAVGTS
ncbi:hypothetical protein [Nocardioides currus]|uniref:ESX secretion-associated protein EspG n=1 Tax=Nocardioides currus TaxID=2133958 RepID=A0A2R7YZS7_9ACTN|nr:hypothetical protein [Nocardioides currus]PUA81888.1 hypothetical protein C7S10_07510 [Nocardioides currus]